MLFSYKDELEFVWHPLSITVLSLAILLCWASNVWAYTDYYRNKKQPDSRSFSIRILILSILTVTLMVVIDSYTKDETHRTAKVESILNNYWKDRHSYSHVWHTLQSTYKCCGVNGSSDWKSYVPLSCYQSQRTWLIWKQTITCRYAHENGCYTVIVKYLDDMASWFKLVGFGFASLGTILTLLLFSTIRTKQIQHSTNSLSSKV